MSSLTIVPFKIIAEVTVPVSPVVTIVPVTSGRVNVLLDVSVAGIKVTARVVVPPARPENIIPSCVAAARVVSEPPVKEIDVPVAAPSTGVTKVGVFAKTSDPEPVSSEITPAS
jgi:hypothetical protein